MVLRKINRDNKLRPKKGKFWCGHCDAELVGDGEKCPKCGLRDDKRRFKKSSYYEKFIGV